VYTGIGIYGSFGSFLYGMALFIVGGDFLAMQIICESTENLIKLSMKFGFL
jgi:hypothetical protein